MSAVVPPSYHGLPLWVVAYDSTYLPRGLVSAGGTLRQEDLLYAGLENPEPILRGSVPGELQVRAQQCPPRTLLRIYWRLDRT